MRILHLTDLHITDSTTSLDDLWSGLQVRFEANTSFDFVIVSGDLVQAANDASSYSAVKRFLRQRILPRLGAGASNAARIIIVPGNHDVDWSRPPGPVVDHRALDDAQLKRLEAYLRGPGWYIDRVEQPQWRLKHGLHGLETLYRVDDRAAYAQRFHAFQAFVEDFYEDALQMPSRMFALLSAKDDDHWSAHLFDKERVAFYGFSSCHHNDAYWRGACVSARAVNEASRHAQQHAQDYLRVAVFHHGAHSVRGDPDHLTTAELGRFANAGFHLGLHGHTHREEFTDNNHELRRKFPILATGSFAVDPSQRPDERNQASLLELNRNLLRWTLYTRAPNEQWSAAPRRSYLLQPDGQHAELEQLSDKCSIDEHARTIDIKPDGIATITVTLRGVELDGELLLACPLRRANALVADPDALVERNGNRAHRKVIVRGDSSAPVFALSGSAERADQITFRYHVASGFALDPVDLKHMQRPSFASELGLNADEDAWIYSPRVATKKLTLTIKYPGDCAVSDPTGHAQEHVGSAVMHAPATKWRDHDAEARHIQCSHDANSATLEISDPRPGVRYALKYRLGASSGRAALDDRTQHLLADVLHECRASSDPYLRDLLRNDISRAILRILDEDASPADTWTGHLWNAANSKLQPAFGYFPPIAWGRDFEYGEGVVGHAFRMCVPAVYHHQIAPRPSQKHPSWLIYRERPPHPHRWVVCIPILARPSIQFGALGVIGCAMPQGAAPTPLQKKLEHMARNYAMSPPTTTEAEDASDDRDPLRTVMVQASCIFWQSLLQADTLKEHKDFIGDFIAHHWPVRLTSDVAPRPGVKQPPPPPKRRRKRSRT